MDLPPPPRDVVLAFLSALLGVDSTSPEAYGARIEVRGFKPSSRNTRKFFRCTPKGVEQAVRHGRGLSKDGHDVFFSVHRRKRAGGKNADVAEFGCLMADLDVGPTKPHPSLEAAEDRVHYLVEAGEIPPPSAVVHSGHGLHLYWFLATPIPISESHQYRSMMKGLESVLDGDAVNDPARIMRLPSTVNWKFPEDPKECELEEFHPERVYEPHQFPSAPSPEFVGTGTELPTDLSPKLKALGEALTEAGHSLEVKKADDRIQAIVIKGPCPICGGIRSSHGSPRVGTAHVAPLSLTLKCKRTSCEASGDGFRPDHWMPLVVPEYWSRRREQTGQRGNARLVDLADVGSEFDRVWKMAVGVGPAPVTATVLCFTAGIGKTTMTLKRMDADAAAGRAGVIAFPTYSLAEEKLVQLKELAPESKVLLVRSLANACTYLPDLKLWQRRLRNLPANVCFGKCPYRDSCEAWTWQRNYAQDPEHTILLCTHASLPYLLDVANIRPAYIVVDEYPAAIKIVQTWDHADLAPIASVTRGNSGSWVTKRRPAALVLQTVIGRIQEKRNAEILHGTIEPFGDYIRGDSLNKLIDKAAEAIGTTTGTAFNYDRSGPEPSFPKVGDLRAPPGRKDPVLDVDDLFDNPGAAGLYVPGHREQGEVRFARISLRLPNFRGLPVVLLDATAEFTTDVLEKQLGLKLTLESVSVESKHAEVSWLRTSSYTARRVTQEPDRVSRSLLKDLKDLANSNGEGKRTYGFITFKRLVEFVRKTLRKLHITADVKYYGDLRGTNIFADVDVLVLVGAPNPHVAHCDFEADQLGVDRNTYRAGKQAAELVQAMARGRDVRRTAENPLAIHCLMAERPPSTNVTVREVARGRPCSDAQTEARRVVREMVARYGFVAPSLFEPSSRLGRQLPTFLQNWYSKHSLVCHLWEKPDSADARAFAKRMRRATSAVAGEDGLEHSKCPNPGGAWRVTVYEIPERRGAYKAWLKAQKPCPARPPGLGERPPTDAGPQLIRPRLSLLLETPYEPAWQWSNCAAGEILVQPMQQSRTGRIGCISGVCARAPPKPG